MDDVGSQSGAGGELPDARDITTKLAAALNAHDLCEALLSIATPLGAGAGLVYLVDRRGELRLQSSRGAARWAQAHPTLPVGASVPLAAVFATGTEMFAETRAELEQRDPAAARLATSLRAAAALPLVHDGRVLGVFALGFDRERRFADEERHWLGHIADQAGAATNRVRLVEDLIQAVRLNELFVGVLAHDLRQPVNAVAVSAALLQSRESNNDGAADVRGDRARTRIIKSAARMSRMIDQLLDFTRLRIGAGLSLEPVSAELAPLVAQIAEEVCDDPSSATVAIDHVGDTHGTWDADRLGQVISNLIGNAVEHGGGGPDGVHVRVDGTEAEAVSVRVHNTGTIAADLLPKLFEPMTAGERRRGGKNGLGLGLYIAREIVAAHGGQLTVTSNEAEGTTFTVSLPRHHATATSGMTPRLLRRGAPAIAGLHAFEKVVRAAADPLPAVGIPTVHERLQALSRELGLRRLQLTELRLETRRLRDRFLAWPGRQGPARSRTRKTPRRGAPTWSTGP